MVSPVKDFSLSVDALMITNLLQNSRCHSTVAKQDLHLPTSSLLIQPSTLAMNFVIFDMLPTSRFSDDCFPI